ncbi:MAG: hypothetical protein C0519_04595 [Hyphomicrobium sp.]|nr:hypothetical protein [Hyphomicrobium sp.]
MLCFIKTSTAIAVPLTINSEGILISMEIISLLVIRSERHSQTEQLTCLILQLGLVHESIMQVHQGVHSSA